MTSRIKTYWWDADGNPRVGWREVNNHTSDEDEIIARMDFARVLEQLSPAVKHALFMAVEGYQLSDSERRALSRARRKLGG